METKNATVNWLRRIMKGKGTPELKSGLTKKKKLVITNQ